MSVTWTSGYLQALAGFVGLVAVGGLLLYLETRQRSRVASYALARRMGLRRGTHLRSLMGEPIVLLGLAFALGAALAYAAVQSVYRLLDVDPNRAPPPLLTIPILHRSDCRRHDAGGGARGNDRDTGGRPAAGRD